MARLWRHRALFAAAAVVLAVVAGVTWYVNRSVPKFLWYWVTDERAIGVQAIDGRNATCWLASTLETTTEVRVDVECHPQVLIGSSTAEGYPYNFDVRLQAPLGDRRVRDSLGSDAVPCVVPRCGMPG